MSEHTTTRMSHRATEVFHLLEQKRTIFLISEQISVVVELQLVDGEQNYFPNWVLFKAITMSLLKINR